MSLTVAAALPVLKSLAKVLVPRLKKRLDADGDDPNKFERAIKWALQKVGNLEAYPSSGANRRQLAARGLMTNYGLTESEAGLLVEAALQLLRHGTDDVGGETLEVWGIDDGARLIAASIIEAARLREWGEVTSPSWVVRQLEREIAALAAAGDEVPVSLAEGEPQL